MSKRTAVLSTLLTAAMCLPPLMMAQDPQSVLTPLAVPGKDSTDPFSRVKMTVRGVVLTQDGHALNNARVEVTDITTGMVVASGYTGPRGNFEIRDLPRGSYEVSAVSGLSEARQRIPSDAIGNTIELRMPHVMSGTGAGDSISVAEMQVPGKAKNELKKAREAIAKNKTADAQKHLAKALEIYPKYSDALTLRGMMTLDTGNVQAALNDLDQAIKCDPNNATAYTVTAAAYNSEKRFDDAMRELERAVALAPNSWQSYFEMAKAQLGKGNFDNALTNAVRAENLAAKPYYPIDLVKGHALLGMKQYSAAIAEFEKYLSQHDDTSYRADAVEQLNVAKAFMAGKDMAQR